MATAQLFVRALQNRSQEVPNLISSHLGDRVVTAWTGSSAAAPVQNDEKEQRNLIAALPLGGRIKLDPWSDELQMIRSEPVASITEREKMPFEITPFLPYLTRQEESKSIRSQTVGAISQAPRGQ
jgi:hypothetical protein